MRKIISVILCVFVFAAACVPACLAVQGGGDEIELTLDVNKRYTDIQEIEDDPLLSQGSNTEKKQQNKTIYITVLIVLLLISIVILVVTLKKVPTEKEIEEKYTAEILGTDTDEKDKDE